MHVSILSDTTIFGKYWFIKPHVVKTTRVLNMSAKTFGLIFALFFTIFCEVSQADYTESHVLEQTVELNFACNSREKVKPWNQTITLAL